MRGYWRGAHEMGGELHSVAIELDSRLVEILASLSSSDTEKLASLVALIQEAEGCCSSNPNLRINVKADVESQHALRLIADDELSSATWLRYIAVR